MAKKNAAKTKTKPDAKPATATVSPVNKHLGGLDFPVMVYFSEEQKARLESAATSEGLGLSAFIRNCVQKRVSEVLTAKG